MLQKEIIFSEDLFLLNLNQYPHPKTIFLGNILIRKANSFNKIIRNDVGTAAGAVGILWVSESEPGWSLWLAHVRKSVGVHRSGISFWLSQMCVVQFWTASHSKAVPQFLYPLRVAGLTFSCGWEISQVPEVGGKDNEIQRIKAPCEPASPLFDGKSCELNPHLISVYQCLISV